jgi:integrase
MDSKLTGIKANNSSIQISFPYNGIRCRETVKVKPTKSSLKEMARKRDAILYEIEFGKFDYLKHFPNSKRAKLLTSTQANNITIKEMINDWFKRTQDQWEFSTKRGYISKITHHIEPNFGHICVSEFKPSIFKDWGATSTLSGKSKNEVRSILRSAFQELYIDEVIDGNPIDRVKRFKHIPPEPQPFNNKEREEILAQMTGQVRNFYEFGFWTGLRISELLALKKCDIDLKRNVIFVRKALVHGREKDTKTISSSRTHQLDETALKVLKAQLLLSSNDYERIFLNPKNNLPWRDDRDIYHNCWVPSLEKSGVKYRSQNNTRHSYATNMLTQNKPIAWIAKQLGHSDATTTLRKYARWIPENY